MDPILVDYTTYAYAAYLGTAVPLTIWVGRTLVKHGRIFLLDAFAGNDSLADAVNRLLAVGFYLVNIGLITKSIEASAPISTIPEVIRYGSQNLGHAMLVLGAMHFFNLFVLSRMRRRGLAQSAPPPVLPNAYLPQRVGAA